LESAAVPKAPHDSLAVLVLIGGFVLGSVLLKTAKKRFSDAQQATLRDRWKLDPILLGSAFGIFVAYYFAPLHPRLAILGAATFSAVCGLKLLRLHAGQGYSAITQGLLVASLCTQIASGLGAVLIRAAL
jgi:hypothetical protein